MKNVDVNPGTCILCGICESSCPTDAIDVRKEERIWSINHRLCIKCGLCISQCPKDSLSFKENDEDNSAVNIPIHKPTKKLLRKSRNMGEKRD